MKGTIVRARFLWAECDSYLAPGREGMMWYLSLLYDEAGQRHSSIETMPETWFIAPIESGETAVIIEWFKAEKL